MDIQLKKNRLWFEKKKSMEEINVLVCSLDGICRNTIYLHALLKNELSMLEWEKPLLFFFLSFLLCRNGT